MLGGSTWRRLRGTARGRETGLFRLLLLGMALVLVAMVSAAVTMEIALRQADVTVPNFKGLTVAEAGHRAAAAGLGLKVEGHLYSGDVAAGRVLNQAPAAGSEVRRERRVLVAESLGPPRVAVPNVVGQRERDAEAALRRLGFNPGAASHVPDAWSVPGTVLAQSPAAGSGGPEGPSVGLLVSDAAGPGGAAAPSGSGLEGFVMPDLRGEALGSAAAAISAAGLKLAPVRYAPAGPHGVGVDSTRLSSAPTVGGPPAPGTVVGQSPTAGVRVDASAPIELTVAR